MRLVGIRNILGQQPYPGCHDSYCDPATDDASFPYYDGPPVTVTHYSVDGELSPMPSPVVIGRVDNAIVNIVIPKGTIS